MKVTVLLADAVQAAEGKLYALGAGWTFIGPQVGPMALGLIVEVPWHEANLPHKVHVQLQDTDGKPAQIGPDGQHVEVEANLEVGRPPGHPAGVPFNVPLALNFGPIPLVPGQGYVWVVSVDGKSADDWRVGFQVRK